MDSRGREIVLGISGGISAYKSCDLLRRLRDHGFSVTVVPTRASLNFVGEATWEALSGRPVATDLWKNVHEVPHVSLAKRADLVIIAPASADILAKIAHGLADDLLTNIVLASDSPLVVVPAMHTEMWQNPATVANVDLLRKRGVVVVEPEVGKLTSGDVGPGRYPETQSIVEGVLNSLSATSDLLGKQVLISAGGTREPLDPVRYIGNRSSGKQGYALALASLSRGAKVTLVSANAQSPDIEGIQTIHVETADQMYKALEQHFHESHIVIMAAAVADAKVPEVSTTKIPKEKFQSITLVENIDIAKTLASQKDGQIIVGFAAQTASAEMGGLRTAASKLQEKGLDFIYFNDVSGGAIFGEDETEGVILSNSGVSISIPRTSKMTLAHKLLDVALDKLG